MKKQELKQKARADWIRIYQQQGAISKAARRCGIARSTLQRWIRRQSRRNWPTDPEGLTG